MSEVKGIIRNKIHKAFQEYWKDDNLLKLILEIAVVADKSVRSQGNADIMYEQIKQEVNNGQVNTE